MRLRMDQSIKANSSICSDPRLSDREEEEGEEEVTEDPREEEKVADPKGPINDPKISKKRVEAPSRPESLR
jgi:hypothetical protein